MHFSFIKIDLAYPIDIIPKWVCIISMAYPYVDNMHNEKCTRGIENDVFHIQGKYNENNFIFNWQAKST